MKCVWPRSNFLMGFNEQCLKHNFLMPFHIYLGYTDKSTKCFLIRALLEPVNYEVRLIRFSH